MDDLISRAEAIDKLRNNIAYMQAFGCDRAITLIREVPSADVQPVRHGRWGKVNECSECGCQPWYERDIHFLHYCPNCGARMDGEA